VNLDGFELGTDHAGNNDHAVRVVGQGKVTRAHISPRHWFGDFDITRDQWGQSIVAAGAEGKTRDEKSEN
jgi:hypothetical protein